MTRRRAAVALAGLLAVSCASVAPRTDAAIAAVGASIAERTGTAVPDARHGTDGGVDAAVAAMLEGELTESDAVRVALLNNRDVRAAYERLGVSAAELVQAGLLHNPVFDGHALFFLDGGTELELGLAQPFVDLFWLPLRRRTAEHELAAATAAVTHELVHLVFAVRREFVRVRAAQQLVDEQRRALDAAVASRELMEQLARAGNVTAPRRTAERIAEGRARLELAAAERAAREAREPLNVLLGLWGRHVAWRVGGALGESGTATADLDLEDVEGRAVARSLDLLENRALADAAAQHAGLASWQGLFPDASLGVAGKREPGGEWGLGPSFALELPVFDDGTARGAAAAARLRERLHRHVQIAVEVRAAARLLRDRLELLAQRAAFLQREFVPAQQQLLHETMQDYNAMQIGVFDVLAQKQQQLAAVRDQVTTLRDLWLARLDLEELLAGSIPTGAEAPFWPEASGPAAGSARGDGAH